jgi:hypothetical protein
MPRFHFESINKTSNSDANLYRNYPKYQWISGLMYYDYIN